MSEPPYSQSIFNQLLVVVQVLACLTPLTQNVVCHIMHDNLAIAISAPTAFDPAGGKYVTQAPRIK